MLIADEPTTALDVTVQAQILDLIRDLQNEFNSSVVLITHDLGVVAEMADDVLVMYAGRAVEYGSADQLFNRPAHPYTWGLLGSMPRFDTAKERAAARDQGHAAQPDQCAARLPVPSSLRVRRAQRGSAARKCVPNWLPSNLATPWPAICPRPTARQIWEHEIAPKL